MIVAKYLPMLFSLFAFSLSAEEVPGVGFEPDLEPCINGAVSASGAYPTQVMEEQIEAYLAWTNQNGRPFYLFRVSGDRVAGAYPED